MDASVGHIEFKCSFRHTNANERKRDSPSLAADCSRLPLPVRQRKQARKGWENRQNLFLPVSHTKRLALSDKEAEGE